jgi:hypothetical protein
MTVAGELSNPFEFKVPVGALMTDSLNEAASRTS